MTVESPQAFTIEPGIKLPRSNDKFSEANNYFQSIFSNVEIKADLVDEAIRFMNNTIYDFFRDNHGTVESTNQTNTLFHKYNQLTIKQLKWQLIQLKRQTSRLRKLGTYLTSFHAS